MIYGKGIRLRSLEREDIPRCAGWLNDPAVRRYLLINLPISTAEETEWFENMLRRLREEHPLAIEIDTPPGWRHIGNIGFHNLDWCNRSAEIGILIGEKELWNQGYGSRAMRLMAKHGFQTLNLNRIYLHVFVPNQGAVHSYEKAGFVLEGRLREDVYREGKYHDVLVMGILRPEWTDQTESSGE